jgi:HEPN domain-containing protein
MKEITKEWLSAANDDLKAAMTLLSDASLTNLVAFHTQQCIEKSFKALAEENSIHIPKTHDLIKLHILIHDMIPYIEMEILYKVNELYIDSRYPGDLGLMPDGKPTLQEGMEFITFAELVFSLINRKLTQ